jgi:hypothetical protein
MGVQTAGVSAVYLDDQMSGWTITNNRFLNCQTGVVIGGGAIRRICARKVQCRSSGQTHEMKTQQICLRRVWAGRRNNVSSNYYERCDTAQHLDNRGMMGQVGSTNCTDVCKPLSPGCGCNTGTCNEH